MDKWIGKNAVVTGASSGIGASILVTLAKAGVNVVGLARRKDRIKALADENKTAKGKIYVLACDVSDPKSIDYAFQCIEKNVGNVHIWINNAALMRCSKLTNDELKDEDIIKTINKNFTGLALCSRKACKLMQKGGKPGYIININSISGQVTASKWLVDLGTNVYSSTKHAVTNITDVLRIELGSDPKNTIRVSSITPAAVITEFFVAAGMPEEFASQIQGSTPQDIADAVVYMLSTPYSVHVTELTIRPLNCPL